MLGLGVCLLMAFACSKDEDPSNCERLEKLWHCTSWTEEGVELFGDGQLITTARLELKTLTDAAGDYSLYLEFLIGGNENVIGAYSVNEACDEITLTPKAGLPETYDFSFEGDVLILTGTGAQANILIQFD